MAKWRYIDDERAQGALANRPQEAPGDEIRDIFEVVGGGVSPYGGGMTLDIYIVAQPGWFVRLLDEELPDHTYDASGLRVLMNGKEVELKRGTLVAFLPPNYQEIANGA